jgi:acetyl esterase/lipase
MPWIYLALSIWGALFVIAALHPSRNRVLLAPTFFMSWMTIELAPHHLLIQWVATLVFWKLGAFESWPGWVGLAIAVASWTALLVMGAQATASAKAMRKALEDLGPGDRGPRMPRWMRVLPFLMKRRRDVKVTRNIEFARVAGRSLRLDVYQPIERGEGRPAVLQIHGGAWVIGDKREQGIPLLGHLASAGWVGFNANYRLSPGATFPDHLVDLKRALAWIREHAAEYGADPNFVCVTGGSAGGHLTALMALTANDPRYQPGFEDVDTTLRAAVPFYGVYDFTNRNGTWDPRTWPMFLEPWVVKAFLHEEPERFAEASPIDQVSADAPPFLVVHGDRDTLAPVEDARTFVEALRAVSTQPVLYAELHGSQHAFDLFPSIRSVQVIEAVERFLRAVRDGTLPADATRAERHVEHRTTTETPAGTRGDPAETTAN